jgi:hypothetical protein
VREKKIAARGEEASDVAASIPCSMIFVGDFIPFKFFLFIRLVNDLSSKS